MIDEWMLRVLPWLTRTIGHAPKLQALDRYACQKFEVVYDIMTEVCAGTRMLSRVKVGCERVVHYARSLKRFCSRISGRQAYSSV